MDRINENTQQQKPKISKLAIASPLVVILGFLTAVGLVILVLMLGRETTLTCSLLYVAFYVYLISSVLGLFLGIVAGWKIRKSKGLFRGYAFSISGIVLGFLLFISFVLFIILMPALSASPRVAQKVLCGANLSRLGKAMQAYSERYDQKYPTPNMWCDLLVEYADVNEEDFLCPAALKSGGRCHYALNPNCFPNSPNDVVLLFETRGGWNKCGGPELMTAEHHQDEGCNILFNNGNVDFIKTKHFNKLKWDNKQE